MTQRALFRSVLSPQKYGLGRGAWELNFHPVSRKKFILEAIPERQLRKGNCIQKSIYIEEPLFCLFGKIPVSDDTSATFSKPFNCHRNWGKRTNLKNGTPLPQHPWRWNSRTLGFAPPDWNPRSAPESSFVSFLCCRNFSWISGNRRPLWFCRWSKKMSLLFPAVFLFSAVHWRIKGEATVCDFATHRQKLLENWTFSPKNWRENDMDLYLRGCTSYVPSFLFFLLKIQSDLVESYATNPTNVRLRAGTKGKHLSLKP